MKKSSCCGMCAKPTCRPTKKKASKLICCIHGGVLVDVRITDGIKIDRLHIFDEDSMICDMQRKEINRKWDRLTKNTKSIIMEARV